MHGRTSGFHCGVLSRKMNGCRQCRSASAVTEPSALILCHWYVRDRKAVVKSTTPSYEASEPPPAPTSRQGSVGFHSHDDILKALARLSDLHQKGILSDDEFKSKKAELLSFLYRKTDLVQ